MCREELQYKQELAALDVLARFGEPSIADKLARALGSPTINEQRLLEFIAGYRGREMQKELIDCVQNDI